MVLDDGEMGSSECPPPEEASKSSEDQNEFLQLIKLVPAYDERNKTSTTTMQLLPQTMESVFGKAGDLPISVISACGTSQSENRFLLSHTIRSLEGVEAGGEADQMGWQVKASRGKSRQVHCSGGRTSKEPSQGVWVWSKPFIINSNGREIAAILVDAIVTPDGLSTDDDVLSAIAGLGLIISSVMVFHSSPDQLEAHLLALDNNLRIYFPLDSDERPTTGTINIPKLSFLIREWNSPGEFPYGGAGGAQYLEDKLNITEHHSAEEKQVREMLQKFFREWACFLLPEIGEKALKSGCTDSLNPHDQKITNDLDTFIKGTMLSGELPTKEVMGSPLSALSLKSCLQTYVENFNEEEEEEVTSLEQVEGDAASSAADELVSSHHSQLSSYLNANPCEDRETLPMAHARIKSAIIERYWEMAQPGKEEHLGQMEDAMDLNFVYIKTKHEDYIQKFQKHVEKSLERFWRQYKEELRKLDDVQLDDPELHSRLTLNIIKEFKQDFSFVPMASSRIPELEKRLKDGLQQVWQSAHIDLSERRKTESYKKAKEHALNYYLERIRTLRLSSVFITDENLGAEHGRILSEAIKEYEGFNKMGEPDPAEEESIKSNLLHAIEEEYGQIQDEIKSSRELAIRKAHECLNWIMECYSSDIKDEMDVLTNLENLQQCHDRAKSNSLVSFKEKFPISDITLLQQFERDLERKMEAQFEKLKKEEMITIRELLVDVRKLYHDEMGKCTKNNLFQRPTHLKDIHQRVKAAVLAKFEKTALLTQMGRLSLVKDIDELYGIYEMKNDMNLNSGDMGAAPAIGIDLGTTYCCVAVFNKGKVHIIPNVAQGSIETTPSYVAFNPDGTQTFGKTAKDDSYKNPEHTIYDAKRIIGRKMDDPSLQSDIRYWPFTVKEDEGVPKVMVNWKPMHPERISGKLLEHCKRMAEEFLKMKPGTIHKAVITVPAYFTDGQRQATVDAGKLAKLDVLMILNEPTAAAIAYSLKRLDIEPRKILIYDLGGGTFDVAVLDVKPKNITVLGVNGDTHLGGENFDRTLLEYCVKKFEEVSGIDLFAGKDSIVKQERDETRRRLRRLETHCEKAKKKLSSAETITVNVDAIVNGTDLAVTVTRKKFEELNMPDFEKSIRLVQETLQDVGLAKDAIDDVVVVGGSSRIPKVQQLLVEFFGGKVLNKSIHPDLAVANGAAVQAALMNGEQVKGHIEFSQIQDVTPMPLGVEVSTKELSVILPKNTKIPTKKKQVYYTVRDNQTSIHVDIYQGEDLKVAKHNKLLGNFQLTGIPPKKQGDEPIDIWMEINSMGILHVEAVCRSNENKGSITVQENKLRMSDETIQEILNEDADSGRDTDQDQDDETSEGDLTSFLLQSSLGELAELAKKVENFSGPHLDRQFRSLRAELHNLKVDLDGLDDTGREVLQNKKGRALRRITNLRNEIAGKIHPNGMTCSDCEFPQEE